MRFFSLFISSPFGVFFSFSISHRLGNCKINGKSFYFIGKKQAITKEKFK